MFEFSGRIRNMRDTALIVRDLYDSMTDPSIISFGGGAPAKGALPIDEMRKVSQDILRKEKRGVEALQYGNPAGSVGLRQQIIDILLKPQGVDASVDEIILVNGGIQTMNVMCELFLNPGDKVIVESPTFVQSVQIFELFEAECIPCSMDEDGLIMSELEEKIKRHKPKIIYTIPTFQNPTGKTLKLERRKKLAELGSKYGVMIIEDDPYRDVRYSGEDIPPVKAFDKTGHTVMACSLSKILSPGIRLGYMVAHKDIISNAYHIMTGTNSHVGMLSKVMVSEFFKQGYYPAHIERIKKLYKTRRDVMLECLEEFFPENITYTFPDGGLFTWVTLPESINTTTLLKEAHENKVAYCTGEGFFAERGGKGRNSMRLSFCAVEVDKIREGMKKLGDLIKSKL